MMTDGNDRGWSVAAPLHHADIEAEVANKGDVWRPDAEP